MEVVDQCHPRVLVEEEGHPMEAEEVGEDRQALELVVEGRPLLGEEVAFLGLVEEAVIQEALDQLAEEVAACPSQEVVEDLGHLSFQELTVHWVDLVVGEEQPLKEEVEAAS